MMLLVVTGAAAGSDITYSLVPAALKNTKRLEGLLKEQIRAVNSGKIKLDGLLL